VATDGGDPLAGTSTATISDCLNRFGAMAADVRRLSGETLFGPAFTARTMAGESSTLHRAVAAAPSGSILVVDAGGYVGRAVWGEILSIAAVARGVFLRRSWALGVGFNVAWVGAAVAAFLIVAAPQCGLWLAPNLAACEAIGPLGSAAALAAAIGLAYAALAIRRHATAFIR